MTDEQHTSGDDEPPPALAFINDLKDALSSKDKRVTAVLNAASFSRGAWKKQQAAKDTSTRQPKPKEVQRRHRRPDEVDQEELLR